MSRGELRIYLGAAPGVGKTYAMLDEGFRRRGRGTDVVIGVVETHGRPHTIDQVRDLEVVPGRTITSGGEQAEEMDVAAVLARRPDVALVDDLAHRNAPGGRNEKRWQDVEELLAAGISVISTVNVQHIESLNDVITGITGIEQRETVPDRVLRAGEQIELVDMSPEALRRRLAHGNVYAADEVDAALADSFRIGNLAAMRELALLWVADRVDEGIEAYRQHQGITASWETRERVVVALTGAPGGERLIRRGARLAGRGHAELVGVHVRRTDGRAAGSQELLDRYRLLLDELGGRYVEVTGGDPAEALVELARAENATQIILGATRRSRWSELTSGSIINRVVGLANAIDVHVISSDVPDARPVDALTRRGDGRRTAPRRADRSARSRAIAWFAALVGVPLLAFAIAPLDDPSRNTSFLLLLLLGPVGVALLGGLAPALVASVIGFAVADFLYISPERSLRVAGPGELLTLVVFIAVSTLVSVLVDRLARRTAEVARGRAEAEALARLAQSTAILDADALERLVGELRTTLGLDAVAVLAPRVDGWQVQASAGEPLPATPAHGSYAAELAGGTTLVAVGPTMAAEDRRLLSAFVAQVRLAQATLALQEEATRADALSEANDLRDALLAAVSHDLRAPLANIKAAATSLTSTEVQWGLPDVRSFATTIDAEADRLTTLVVNLLDLSRLQAGMLGTKLAPTAPTDVIYAALASLTGDTTAVDLDAADSLPLVSTDPALLERVLANVVRNAIDWAPPATRVRVEAAPVGDRIVFRVVDRGPGIPLSQRDHVFQAFQRLGDGGRAALQGLGLGLAVARGFCDAIGAEIVIDDTPGGGTTVAIAVPLADQGSPAATMDPMTTDASARPDERARADAAETAPGGTP
jgi:two-component system sensor histidine kinase KdpD